MAGIAAIVLAGGSGRRMRMDVPKQYMEVQGHPLIYYTLRAFEESSVDEVVLVTGRGDENLCQEHIVNKYGFQKVHHIVAGGRERYDSVYCGLKELEGCDYVLVHDGARACVSKRVIEDAIACVKEYGSAVAAVPVKDTIKQADSEGYVQNTPDRSTLWQIQTPQAFHYARLLEAYDKMYAAGATKGVTDDSMVMERFGGQRIRLYMADYNNVKITTPEDVVIVERLLENQD